MVHEIIRSKYRIFVETLVFTLLIVLIGFLIGFLVEYGRTNAATKYYQEFEITSLDLKLQNYYYQIMNQSACGETMKQNLIFADNIYNTGLLLQKYEDANELTDNILLEKKKYVLLDTELWMNSILLKQKCSNPFHTVVYVYSQNADLIKEAEQNSISDTLRKIKEEKGNSIILIPMAGDLGLDVVDMQMRIYNVTSLPSVIIDEKTVLTGFHSEEEILKYLN